MGRTPAYSNVLGDYYSMEAKELKFSVEGRTVSAILLRPQDARWLLVFAHGAGAGMRHPFMERVSQLLSERRIATFRYQFPYMECGGRRPDPAPILQATIRAALSAACSSSGDLPLLAGGKSLGGRMTSLAAAEEPLPLVRGLVFFGFPLHAPGSPGTERAKHLAEVSLPMLFLQGTRDKLADLELLRPICRRLGERATLHILEGADHSFHVLKSSGIGDAEVLADLTDTVAEWANGLN